jgi:integrase
MLIISDTKSLLNEGDKVEDIKASILSRGSRKYWYVRYQVLFENEEIKTGEESTKVLKNEKTLKYMQSKYLPVWISRKRDELKAKKVKTNKFAYYYDKFLEYHKDDKSFYGRIYVYKKIYAHFKDMDISKITRLMVKEYLDTLKIKDRSKKDYLGCIKGVLNIALDDDVIDKNVATSITFKRSQKELSNPFSQEEVSKLLDRSEGMLKNYLGIAFNTGMRSGEILGLMHHDIKDDLISVKRSISKGRITTPKTLKSIRDIPMFESAKPYIESQMQLSQSLYLFDYDKSFIKDVTYFKRRWHKLIEDCDIPYRKIYNTRHTFITAMLNSGKFKIMQIAALVGHTSPQMIMTNYAGFIQDEHLKVDTSVNIFEKSSGDTLGDTIENRLTIKA